MTHHFAMTSSLLIKILKIDKFGAFSSDIDFKTQMDIFRDDISLIINQCDLQATEGSLRRTQSVRQPRRASKRSEARLLIINQSQLNGTCLIPGTGCDPVPGISYLNPSGPGN